jgi:hypothetical protein
LLPARPPGTHLAAHLLVLTFIASSTACLVTDRIDFPAEINVPASVVSAPGAKYPLDRVGIVFADETQGDDGEPRELAFEVIVRDPNRDQNLQAQVYVDLQVARISNIPPSGTIERSWQFIVPLAPLLGPPSATQGTCHKIELLVSADFQGQQRVPADSQDLAVAVWWVGIIRQSQQVVDLSTCPQ